MTSSGKKIRQIHYRWGGGGGVIAGGVCKVWLSIVYRSSELYAIFLVC
jgi:hypothetical protein